MPRNGSGIYSLPPGLPSNGETSNATDDILTPFNDMATDMNTARPVVAGGTGSTSASAARTALGLEIGSDIEAHNDNLTSLAGLTFAANKGLYTTGANTAALFDLTVAGRALLDDASASDQRTTLGLGTSATLNVGTSANNIVQLNGAGELPALDGSNLTGINPGVWSAVETVYDDGGTVPTIETSDFVDGFQYRLIILGLQMQTATEGTDLEVYGVTAGAYTSAVQFMGGATGNPYRYAIIELVSPRSTLNTHFIRVGSSRASSGSGDAFFLGSNNDDIMIVRYTTAQKIQKVRISGGNMTSGIVRVERRPV